MQALYAICKIELCCPFWIRGQSLWRSSLSAKMICSKWYKGHVRNLALDVWARYAARSVIQGKFRVSIHSIAKPLCSAAFCLSIFHGDVICWAGAELEPKTRAPRRKAPGRAQAPSLQIARHDIEEWMSSMEGWPAHLSEEACIDARWLHKPWFWAWPLHPGSHDA